jgi:hypothetical protein
MDNFITGLISVVVFVLFVGGLAESIGAIPFGIIVAAVSLMIIVDFVQSLKQGAQEKN